MDRYYGPFGVVVLVILILILLIVSGRLTL